MTPPVMPYIHLPQKERNNQIQQSKQPNEQQKSHEVRQDGYAPRPNGVASTHAVRAGEGSRTRPLNTQYTRSKKHSTRRQTVHLAVWVTQPISLEVDRVARELHLTRSKAGRYLMERGLSDDIFNNHMRKIIETIEEAATKASRKGQKPVRDNSYRSAYYSAQNRTISINTLHLLIKLLQEPPDTLRRILHKSEEEARDALTLLSPQIADLIRKQEHEQSEEGEREE